ncbi:MAG: hypothetical protein NWE78_02230 [Candidatus Bathyarchaeota archaeon]|nr:hypothetical protein [Candidatus Bathyarchaeota archaeon]
MLTRLVRKTTLISLMLCIAASALPMVASGIVYEENWTFTYINEPPYGNWTFSPRPANPVKINSSQIQVGANWTYVYTLTANSSYHLYCYGDWISEGSEAQTDYDIYVYNPLGEMEGYHTEAAGLPEHLGTSVEEPFFTPNLSGNYSFVVRNDPRESEGADAATVMAIEHVETNAWHSRFIEGKQGSMAVENTSWAYEFVSNSSRIEIQIQVPDTLDMYEARLYLMANPSVKKGEFLNGVPVAWEAGLFGETSSSVGGYNLISEGFRGNAYASCEFFGQDMLINYSAPYSTQSLYHLVLIGESGAGNVNFRIKTDFGDSILQLTAPTRVYPYNETEITATSSKSKIQEAYLYYSPDNTVNITTINMHVSNKTCNATIPGQEPGETVFYYLEAFDILDNVMLVNGSFQVKYPTSVNFTLASDTATIGENISISGIVKPPSQIEPASVILILTSLNGSTLEQHVFVESNGSFSISIRPFLLGSWRIRAHFLGDQGRYESFSEAQEFVVVEPSFVTKYSIYIAGASVGTMVLIILVLILIRRRQG